MSFLQWTVTAVRFLTDYDWPTFILLVILDALLLSYLLYRLILLYPFGATTWGDFLLYTCAFFLSCWLVAYVLVNTAKIALSGLISNESIIHRYGEYLLIVVAPITIYLYSMYHSYMGNPYLTAKDLKREEGNRLRVNENL